MIGWSLTAIKFTSGIGALCMAALMAELTPHLIPIWLAIAVAMLPLVVFVFVQPGEMPTKVVRPCQLAAAIWYLALSGTLTVLFFEAAVRDRGWPVFFVGLAVGAIPCVVFLWREITHLPDPNRGVSSSAEDIMRQVPPLRQRQFALIAAAKDRLHAWANQHGIPLHRVEFVVPFVETDFALGVWLFFTTDSDLACAGENERAAISAVFIEALRSLDYPSEWLAGVTFQYDSHEHVERAYG